MAEGNAKEGEETNWWGGWMKTVQEKSGHAWEQMRKDLGEFGSTIQRDTAQAAATTATLIKDQLKVNEEEEEVVTTSARMKVGFSKLLTGLSQSLTPAEGGQSRDDDVPIAQKNPHLFDKGRARLHAMQTDPTTYCSDPDGHPVFRDWLEAFDVDSYKGEISELLVVNTDVRALYTKLVPAAVSHVEFWGRYFYRVQQLKEDEARRRALKERADMTSSQKFEEEEDLGWGDEEDTWDTMPDALRNQSGSERFVVLPENSSEPEAPSDQKEENQTNCSSDSHETTTRNTETDHPPSHEPKVCNDSRNSSPADPEDIPPSPEPIERKPKQDSDRPNETKLESAPVNDDERKDRDTPKSDIAALDDEHPATPAQPQVSSPSEQRIPEEQTSSAAATETGNSGHVTKEEEEPRGSRVALEKLTIQTEREEEKTNLKEQISPVASDGSNRESSLSDDWEKDFDDIEVTEEDLKNASARMAKGKVEEDDLDDDWESWE